MVELSSELIIGRAVFGKDSYFRDWGHMPWFPAGGWGLDTISYEVGAAGLTGARLLGFRPGAHPPEAAEPLGRKGRRFLSNRICSDLNLRFFGWLRADGFERNRKLADNSLS